MEIDTSRYMELQKLWKEQHQKYNKKTDDEIDQLIDMQVKTAINKWIQNIGLVQIESAIFESKLKEKQFKLEQEELSKKFIKLREVALEEIESVPTPTDEEMERLIRGEL